MARRRFVTDLFIGAKILNDFVLPAKTPVSSVFVADSFIYTAFARLSIRFVITRGMIVEMLQTVQTRPTVLVSITCRVWV